MRPAAHRIDRGYPRVWTRTHKQENNVNARRCASARGAFGGFDPRHRRNGPFDHHFARSRGCHVGRCLLSWSFAGQQAGHAIFTERHHELWSRKCPSGATLGTDGGLGSVERLHYVWSYDCISFRRAAESVAEGQGYRTLSLPRSILQTIAVTKTFTFGQRGGPRVLRGGNRTQP
jgi:hypothetical protein